MEAARQSAHLSKENVQGSSDGGDALLPAKRHATPKHAFGVHVDSAPSVKKGLREKRRALGDISNQQRGGLSSGGGQVAHTNKPRKSGGLRKSEGVRVKKAKTTAAKPVAAPAVVVTPTQPAKVQEVEDVEHAYGGLLSREPDTSYLASLRAEMLSDIMSNKTRSLIDDYEPTDTFGVWDDEDERTMLATGAAPSSWWSQATAEFAEDVSGDRLWDDTADSVPLEDDVPLPDELPAPRPDETESDELLDELLSVDVDAACQ